MNRAEFKARLYELFSAPVDSISYEEKMDLVEKYFIEYQIKNDNQREPSKRGQSWTDKELRTVLSNAPTKSNCLKFARIFDRSYGSIELIYRWASTDDKTIREKRPNDAFVAHVKQIAKELGWRGT